MRRAVACLADVLVRERAGIVRKCVVAVRKSCWRVVMSYLAYSLGLRVVDGVAR